MATSIPPAAARTRCCSTATFWRPSCRPPIATAACWLGGEERYDREALKEWLLEAKVYQTLPELVADYLNMSERFRELERLIQAGGPVTEQVATEHKLAPQKLDKKRE